MASAFDQSLSHAQHERLAHIDFRLFFLGSLRRSDISERFGMGSAAATRDLAAYRQYAGNTITLDHASKQYFPEEWFRPLFSHRVDHALATLALGFGAGASESIAPLFPCETPHQLNNPKLEILAAVTRGIHQKRVLKVRYNSFTSGETEREIIPFALASNGLRWHVRAYDRLRRRFSDFVLTRLANALDLRSSTAIEPEEQMSADIQWNRIVSLDLVPHPTHARQKEAIEMDYGMRDGVLRVNVRAALAGYFLRQWSVDSSRDASLPDEEFRLWLRNHLALYDVDSAKVAPGFRTIID